jgi:hypothetical protein
MTDRIFYIPTREAAKGRLPVCLVEEHTAKKYAAGLAVFVCTKKDGDYRHNATSLVLPVKTAKAAVPTVQPVFAKGGAEKKMEIELSRQYKPWANNPGAFMAKRGWWTAFKPRTTGTENANETVL